MDKSTWQKTRHSSCKGSNVGKALDEFAKFCPDIQPGKVPDNVVDPDSAENAARNLATALTKAAKALKKPTKLTLGPDKKKIEATDKLIKQWQTEVKRYQSRLKTYISEYDDREAQLEAMIKSVDTQVKSASVALNGLLEKSNAVKAGVASTAKKLSNTKLDVSSQEKLRAQLASYSENSKELAAAAKDLMSKFRRNADLVKFREFGGLKMVRNYGLWPRDEAKYVKLFQDRTKTMSDVEAVAKKLIARADKQTVAIATVIANSDTALSGVEKAGAIMQALINSLNSRYKRALNFMAKQPANQMLKLDAKELTGLDDSGRKKQRHNAEGQIKQVEAKIADLETICAQSEKMFSRAVKAVDKAHLKNTEVAPHFKKAYAIRTDIRSKAGEWISKHKVALTHAEKYLDAFAQFV